MAIVMKMRVIENVDSIANNAKKMYTTFFSLCIDNKLNGVIWCKV